MVSNVVGIRNLMYIYVKYTRCQTDKTLMMILGVTDCIWREGGDGGGYIQE